MKRILFTLLFTAITSMLAAQAPRVVDARIKTLYQEDYTFISVDTVAMPIRIVMALDYAMTVELAEATKAIKEVLLYEGLERIRFTEELINSMQKKSEEYISINDVIAMRNSNRPHEDDYYNYQRTTVYLHDSGYKEEFYVRIGEKSISMTRTEYDLKEDTVVEQVQTYKKTIKELKALLKQMYEIEGMTK